MYLYFIKRMMRQKTFYIAVIAGCAISILHIWKDVLPYTDPSLRHSPYTKWIESCSPSVFTSLLFMLMPILASMGMAHLYRRDENQNYLSHIICKGKKKSYFAALFGSNFIFGGLAFIIPILCNIYLCFLLLPNQKINFILEPTNNVSLLGKDTLFPGLYYDHPLLHMFLYVLLDFIIAGIFASLALAISFWIKNIFFVWIVPFAFCYVYETIICAIFVNGGRRFCPTSFTIQVDAGVEPFGIFLFVGIGCILSAVLYCWGIKNYESY